ncbi:hypothetical protein EVAR_60593_1 [Eumeta japonica]|uniref:Uncharacterized protein n=1 Tax=Eumeta variegata TaxID=151549 RepID=A0A4C1YGK3_EUMVA|nr:hypothetical protein EVAR_60593_1 [Eumeta japonica]
MVLIAPSAPAPLINEPPHERYKAYVSSELIRGRVSAEAGAATSAKYSVLAVPPASLEIIFNKDMTSELPRLLPSSISERCRGRLATPDCFEQKH